MIDTYRLLAAFAIVFIHVSITDFGLGTFENSFLTMTLLIIAKLAVPLFFALSGYLVYRDSLNAVATQSKKQAIKIAYLFLLSSALFVVFKLVYQQPIDPTPTSIVNFLLFNSTDFFAPPLWFLAALLYLLVLFHLAAKYVKHMEVRIATVSLITFFVGIVTYTYGSVFFNEQIPLHVVRNFLFFGLPYFMLGYLVAKYARNIQHIKQLSIIKFSFIAIGLYVFEYIVLSGGGNLHLGIERYDFYLFMPLVVTLLLFIAVRHPQFLSRTILPSFGSQYAVYIYIVHLIVITVIYSYIIENSVKINSEKKMLIVYAVCCLLSLLVSMLYVKMKIVFKRIYEEKNK